MIEGYEKPILLEDLGMRFPTENSKRKYRYGLFRCFCGNEFVAQIMNIKRGRQKSCGCSKNKITHGLSKHRLYKTWSGMMQRCYNPKNPKYKIYGGRGITVCERWHSIENFIEDMFPTFEEGLSLDRINVDGDYELKNCRWANIYLQNSNTTLLSKSNTSGYRGVCWNKGKNKWEVAIWVQGKKVYLGVFINKLEGAITYNNYIIENDLEHPLNIIKTEER